MSFDDECERKEKKSCVLTPTRNFSVLFYAHIKLILIDNVEYRKILDWDFCSSAH